MPDQITDADIVNAALSPKSATNDQGSITERDIDELIKARDAIGGTGPDAARSAWAGLRWARVVPPGAQ